VSYFINLVEEERCLSLTFEGEMPSIETAAARQEVAELLAARRWNRIIVDITAMRSVPKAVELFDLGGALSRSMPRSPWIALVGRSDQVKHARLLETVARNGGAFLTFFIDAEKAEAWVRGDPPMNTRGLLQCSPKPVTQEQNQQQEENHNA